MSFPLWNNLKELRKYIKEMKIDNVEIVKVKLSLDFIQGGKGQTKYTYKFIDIDLPDGLRVLKVIDTIPKSDISIIMDEIENIKRNISSEINKLEILVDRLR